VIDKTLFIVCIFLVFGLSSCASVTKYYDGRPGLYDYERYYYEYNIGQGHILKSFLGSTLKKLIKYPDVKKAFADGSLLVPPDTLKDYTIEPFISKYIVSENGNSQIQIELDYSSKKMMNLSGQIVEISDKYEIGNIPKLPQILIDHYRSYLDELLGDPEFIALSETLRDANDAEIARMAEVGGIYYYD
jgi:hypothetical protein